MEDSVSRSSCDSAVDEFVVVSVEPKLRIAGNGGHGELEQKLTEVLSDDANNCISNCNKMADVKSGDVPPEAPSEVDAGDSTDTVSHVCQQNVSESNQSVYDFSKGSDSLTRVKNTAADRTPGGMNWFLIKCVCFIGVVRV
jgi:hypothetical protein